MKIFIITKRKILLIGFVTLLMTMISLYLVFQNRTEESTLEANSDYNSEEEFSNKIQKIMSSKEKIAYLTFDDGPNPIVTPKVLDILKEEDVKATFFVIGKHVDAYAEIVKRAYEEGHYIANHTYRHNNKILYRNKETFMNEIEQTERAIKRAIGKEDYCSHLFRFPNGYMAPLNKSEKKNAIKILAKMNYAYIDWNCLNNDSMKKYTKEQLLNNLKKSAQNKGTLVILMHDTKDVSDSSEVLQDSIKYLKNEGYVFKNFYEEV